MTQIKKVKTSEGVQFYPQTHTKAVIDDNGYTAESRLQAMQDEINQKQLEVGAVPSDLTPTKDSSNWVTSNGVYLHEPLMKTIVQIDSSKMESFSFFVNSGGKWESGGGSIVIPCTEGDEFRLTLTSSSNGNWQTWLNSSYTSPSSGANVPFVSGYSRIWTSPSEVVLTAPKGACYLLLGTLTGDRKTGKWVGDATVVTKISDVVNTKTTSEYVQNVKTEIEKDIEKSKYHMTEFSDVWSTTNASIISYEKDGEDAVITVTSKTALQRCGFSIADVKVGEKIYVDFSSNIGIPFGVGETLSSTWVWLNDQSYKSSFYFTKTSSTQKYIYIAANSFDVGTVIRLVGFKVYKSIGFQELDTRMTKLESYDFYPSSYIPIKENYERYMSISGTQGSTIYGNYFVQGFSENAKISIYNLETKTKVQDVTLPTFGNTRFHANTISFSGTKYDSGDDFPLLYICAGYVNTNNPTISEVYVVRIVGTSGEYTSELVQTINLAFSTWTEFVCDPVRNRAWINGSGIARYICVTIPDITESEVTIDTNTAIIDKFDTKSFVLGTTTKSSGQGRFFYHNRVYYVSGVPSYAGEGVEALYVVVDNVLTHCTEAVVPLMNFGLTGEPEGCFIWKDEFYVAYRGSIVKLIQN